MKFINSLILISLMSVVVITGCDDDDDIEVAGVTLDKQAYTLEAGQTVQLTATVLPDDATDKTVTWTSENQGIATVDANGLVKAVANGETNIVARAGGKEAKCILTVTPDDYAAEITGDYTGTITGTIPATIENATISVVYKSKNVVVLKLDQQLMTGINVKIDGECAVSKDGDQYKITGTIPSFELNDNTLDNPVNVNGAFDGNDNTTINISLNLMGMDVNVVFAGKKD